MNNRPLVSIVVLTYNSSEYVLETLNSAYRQTYQGELELIITDDCSKDNTVDVCREWLQTHGSRFVRTELITVEENTGVSKNINRGCRAAQGEWIKPIAGDDILMDDCINTLINFALEKGNECKVVASQAEKFYSKDDLLSLKKTQPNSPIIPYREYTIYKSILNCMAGVPTAPGTIYYSQTLKEIGYFEEIVRNDEDGPTIHKLFMNNIVIYEILCATVFYRINMLSLSNAIDFHTNREIGSRFVLYYQRYIKYYAKGFFGLICYLLYIIAKFRVKYDNDSRFLNVLLTQSQRIIKISGKVIYRSKI